MAEGVGFEPTLGLPLSLISSQVPSTTQPPFRSLINNNLHRIQSLRLNFLTLQSDTVRMKSSETEKDSEWQKRPYANLVRDKSSGIYFARFRVRGKLIRRGLKTSQISVAKLRLADMEKQELQRVEHQTVVAGCNVVWGRLGDLQSTPRR
jgi:hypothetical protein